MHPKVERSLAASSAMVVVSPFIRTVLSGAIYGSWAALHTIGSYSPECVEGSFSEVPIATVQHEGGLIYRAWDVAFRFYPPSNLSFSVFRSFLSWRFTARF